MKKIIHNLRQQPEQVRRHILHIATMVLGVIFFLLWIYTLGTNLGSDETQAEIKNDLKPLTTLKENIVDGYNNINAGTIYSTE